MNETWDKTDVSNGSQPNGAILGSGSVSLTTNTAFSSSTASYSITPSSGSIRLWKLNSSTGLYENFGTSGNVSAGATLTFYVEGLSNTTTKSDVKVQVNWSTSITVDGVSKTLSHSSTARAGVWEVDIDMASDNGNLTPPPSGRVADEIEASDKVQFPGCFIFKSRGFASGLGLEGNPLGDIRTATVTYTLKKPFDKATADVTIGYPSVNIPRVGEGIQHVGASNKPRYILAGGGLRLWKDARTDGRSFKDGGNFVPPGTYKWSEVFGDSDSGSLTIEYVDKEASTVSGKQLLTVKAVDPAFTAEDKLNAFAFPEDILISTLDNGLIKKGDALTLKLNNLSVDDYSYLNSKIEWQTRQMQLSGAFLPWVARGSGLVHAAPANVAGIFEVRAKINVNGGTEAIYSRKDDDIHSRPSGIPNSTYHHEGAPECVGVYTNNWQKNILNQARPNLGATNYARAAKFLNFPNPSNKCNQFVAHKATDAGAIVPFINGLTNAYPPTANQWAGTESKAIPNWSLVSGAGLPEPGQVVSKGAPGSTGHCGFLDYDGAWISAGSTNVNRRADLRESLYSPGAVRNYTN